MDGLDESPVSHVDDKQVHILRSSRPRELAYINSYFPEVDIFSDATAEMMVGNWQGIYHQIRPEDFTRDWIEWISRTTDVVFVVSCLDSAAARGPRGHAWAWEHWQQVEAQSPTFAPFRYQLPMLCARWPLVPSYDFQEPFGTPPPDAELSPGAPAAPLFLLSTRADPTTPLANAWETSRQHPNSSVVVLELGGHDQFSRASDCVRDAVRVYFDEGVVPPNGTSCEPVPRA